MRTHIIYICSGIKLLLCCLLSWLPVVAAGQTSAPYVAKKQGVEWYEMLTDGGMVRQGTDFLDKHRGWYVIMPKGLSDIISMNYVDGYSVGLHSTIGRMQLDRSRWELEETARWAFGRHQLVAKVAVRYFMPVEYETFFELYGGQHVEDFDPDPLMPMSQSLLASGICGWNHYKLYERTSAGFRFATPLTFELKMSANVGWERRRAKENSVEKNIFGAHAQSNIPRVGVPHTAHELMLYEGPVDAELAKASLRFDYLHHRSLMVMDDMTVRETLRYPTISLLLDMGAGKNREADNFRFLSVDARVNHTIACARLTDKLVYEVSIGFMMRNGTIGLADMHHFDASRFWWQKQNAVTRFALLDNYEFSTDRHWAEGHVEWSSTKMLFTQLITPKEDWREFVQLHAVRVPSHRFHWEAQYGWELLRLVRVGVSVGFNDTTYRGTAVTMTLDLNAMGSAKK